MQERIRLREQRKPSRNSSYSAIQTIPGSVFIPFGCWCKIILILGVQMFLYHFIIQFYTKAWSFGNIREPLLDHRTFCFHEARPVVDIDRMMFERHDVLSGGGTMNVGHKRDRGSREVHRH